MLKTILIILLIIFSRHRTRPSWDRRSRRTLLVTKRGITSNHWTSVNACDKCFCVGRGRAMTHAAGHLTVPWAGSPLRSTGPQPCTWSGARPSFKRLYSWRGRFGRHLLFLRSCFFFVTVCIVLFTKIIVLVNHEFDCLAMNSVVHRKVGGLVGACGRRPS